MKLEKKVMEGKIESYKEVVSRNEAQAKVKLGRLVLKVRELKALKKQVT